MIGWSHFILTNDENGMVKHYGIFGDDILLEKGLIDIINEVQGRDP